jgi:hypothetical protein
MNGKGRENRAWQVGWDKLVKERRAWVRPGKEVDGEGSGVMKEQRRKA